MEAISRSCVKQFCTENNIKLAELAQIAGYSTPGNFSRALLNGYIKSEAVFNMCQFFDLPRNYFENTHIGDDIAKVSTTPDQKLVSAPIVTNWDMATELMEFYGENDYTALFIRLVTTDYKKHKNEILAKRYEGMSREELIEKLVQLSA